MAERRAPIPKPEVKKKTKNIYRNKRPKKHKIATPVPNGEKVCQGCGKKYSLSIHHCFFGGDKRDLSSLNKCTEWLCHFCHQSSYGIHGSKTPNYELDHKLKIRHQERLMNEGMSLEEFVDKFGSNYAAMTTEEFLEEKKKKEKFIKREWRT